MTAIIPTLPPTWSTIEHWVLVADQDHTYIFKILTQPSNIISSKQTLKIQRMKINMEMRNSYQLEFVAAYALNNYS